MLGVLLIAGWLDLGSAAPSAPSVPPAPSAPQEATVAAERISAADDYHVGIGDVLEIVVLTHEDLSRSATIQTNGEISLPLLGDVPVAGQTLEEIKLRLTSLLAKDFLVDPQVEVHVREYRSQFVTVVGEVNQPGRKALRGPTRVIDVLVESGGFRPNASGEVALTRLDGTFADGSNMIQFHLGGSTMTPEEQGYLEIELKSGDILTALPKYYVIVYGEVNRPNRYVLDGDLTVMGAISLAGGMTRFGSNDVELKRIDPATGIVKIIPVDLKAVRKGKQPDPQLQPNDTITVKRRLF